MKNNILACLALGMLGFLPLSAFAQSPTMESLQAELAACRSAHENAAATEEDPQENATPATRTPAPPYRRGYRAERLECEDYSHSYFQRHPSMAAVCGVDLSENTVETISITQPGVQISATIHKVVTTSQKHSSSTLPSATSPR